MRAILTFASPHQGAPAANTAYGEYPGYFNGKPLIDNYVGDMTAGPTYSFLQGLLSGTVAGFAATGTPIQGPAQVYAFANGLGAFAAGVVVPRAAMGAAEGFSDWTIENGVKENIAPGGTYINLINSTPNPPNYRSVIGAEEGGTPARFAGSLVSRYSVGGPRRVEFTDDLARLADDIMRHNLNVWALSSTFQLIDHEREALGAYMQLQIFYDDHVTQYRARANRSIIIGFIVSIVTLNPLPAVVGTGARAVNNFLADSWQRGALALSNLDAIQGQLIGSFRMEQRTARVRVGQHCIPDREDIPGNPIPGDVPQLDLDVLFERPACEEGESPYTYETRTYYVPVPTANDGFVVPEYNVWSSGGAFDDAHNPYYGAGGATAENSGYNHSEIKFDRRDHDDPTGRYSEGQRNPPVEDAEGWMFEVFGAGS